ncbi:Thiolase, N-terminal domain-containing protein [Flagelloscypha sp. PMI_526]|nr:Thiolase, N-terminal domain-containing protein [Flagelloscypha sp. PMI_526]
MTLYHFNRHQMRIGTGGLNDLSKSETLSIPDAADCLIPMGFTSENVASDYGITREEQDVFALHSMQKAAKAQETGFFDSEIIPVHLPDNKIVDTDDGIRPETSLEALSKIRPAFKTDGSTTGGNASQVTDGAAAVLMTRRSKAKELGLPILGKYCSFVTAGVPPRVMGIGPAYAIPKLFTKTRITKEDVDFFEINEAFASQAIYCIETLGLPKEKVNPVGGAIALGHPLGATGVRQVVTALNYASRMNKPQLFVTSMCMGSGMGAAALFVSEA